MQKDFDWFDNNLFEDMPSSSNDIDIDNIIPSEQDFEKIALRYHDYKLHGEAADYLSTPQGLARSTVKKVKKIKYLIIAILIGYEELAAILQKDLKSWYTKEQMQEIINKILETNLNTLCQYTNKYAVEKNESLQEASGSKLTAIEKMQAFNNGTRKENVKACSDQKLFDYQLICKQNNFNQALHKIEDELRSRGYKLWPEPNTFFFDHRLFINLLASDFTSDIAKAVKDCDSSPADIQSLITNYCITHITNYNIERTKKLFVLLIFALMLKKQDIIDTIKVILTNVYQSNLSSTDIKDILNGILAHSTIMQQIANCLNQISAVTENLDEALFSDRQTLKSKYCESLKEDIEKHDTLNPKLWNEDATLKSEVKDKILEIVKEFENNLVEDNIKFNVKDIILVGSNVNYNYTKDSDLDIHIIADTNSLNCPDNLYPALYSAYRSLFNKNLDIEFYGIPVEIYIETEESPRISNGCYSVSQDKWISEPNAEDIPEYDKEQLNNLVTEWETKYNELLDKNNLTADDISSFIEQIYELRKEGLASGSEWDIKNLAFKEFRNKGYLDHLKKLKNEVRGQELSLESLEENTEKVKDHKWVNRGKEGTHGEFKTKKEADAQRRAMFSNGFHEDFGAIEKYKIKLQQISHYQPIVQENGLFEIYNVPELDVDRILVQLRQLPECDWVQKAQSSFDFNHFTMSGQPRARYKIYGQLKFK